MTTVGGTISGYSLMGSSGIATRPAVRMRMDTTEAKIGRSMKKDEMFMAAQFDFVAAAAVVVASAAGAPIVIMFGLTCAPGRTRCSPLTTTTSSGDRKSTRLNSSHANISYAV